MALPAKTVDIPDEKMEIQIPDSWTQTGSKEGSVFAASDGQNTSQAALFSYPNGHQDGVDEPAFLNGVKEGFTNKITSQGMTLAIAKEGLVTINGVPFYSLEGTFGPAGGQTTRFHTYVTAANNRIYVLSLQSLLADPETDFQSIANSLTFQTPPTLPDPNRPKTRAEKIAYLLGKGLGVVAILAILGWLIKRIFFKATEND